MASGPRSGVESQRTVRPANSRRRKKRGRTHPLPRDRFEYAALRLLAVLIRMLPLEIAATMSGAGWRLFGPLTKRHRRALSNLALAFPAIDESSRRRIAADQWENLGRTFAESFFMDRISADPGRVELAMSAEVHARFAAPGGRVLVSMHSANWEIAALPIRRYRHVAALYQRLTNPLVEGYVKQVRAQIYDGGLFTKAPSTPARIMQWVREGHAMAILADGREARGIAVSAFGHPMTANPFPALVARRLGRPLLAGRVVRLPGSRFRVDAVEIEVPVTDDFRADVAAATQAMQDRFDGWIRERPGEWMWVQDRWRPPKSAGRPPRKD